MLSTATKIQIASLISKTILMFRRLAGKCSASIVCKRGSLVWNLDLNQGIDLQIYLWGQFEPSTARCINRYLSPDSIVLDIGANIGSHALPIANQLVNGKVFAIEPTDLAFSILKKNLNSNFELNDRLFPVHLALGEPDQKVPPGFYSTWNVVEKDPQAHPIHLGTFNHTSIEQILTLDEFVKINKLLKVDLIKIDVDGYEVKILRGADYVLRALRPIFIAEIAPYALEENGDSLEEFLERFIKNRYKILHLGSGKPLLEDAQDLRRRLSRGSINVKIIPNEKLQLS